MSDRQILDLDAQKRATATMVRALRGWPIRVRNIVYSLFRADANTHNKRGHLLGQFPEVANACAEEGAPIADVFAPVDQFRSELKARHYSGELPPLSDVEREVADAECRLQKAELNFEQHPKDGAARQEFREADRELFYATELMSDVFEADIREMGITA